MMRIEHVAKRSPFFSRSSCRRLVQVLIFPVVYGLYGSLVVFAFQDEAKICIDDETAPPGGLALIRVTLTEPKPVSSGQLRLFYSEESAAFSVRGADTAGEKNPLGQIVAIGFFSKTGHLAAAATLGSNEVTLHFFSPDASFGIDSDLPIIVVAVRVKPDALPGSRVGLKVDLSASRFLDAKGQPYELDVKAGEFEVGGVSIDRIITRDRTVTSGSTVTLKGVGFQPGARIEVQNAGLASARFISSQQIEITMKTGFEVYGTCIRLRNPDGSEHLFYGIPGLVEFTQ